MLEVFTFICLHALLGAALPQRSCRCMPSDSCWPSPEEWQEFNKTVEWKLVATRPLAQACHEPSYDAFECQNLQSEWTDPFIHDTSSSSPMAPAVLNRTCDPFFPKEDPCKLGNMVVYSVNATAPEDFSKTIAFAKDRNIRLVIRNTGHDFSGKSTGAGALSIWTHYVKSIEHLDYASSHYSGPAVKLGAGVQVWEAYNATNKKGQVMVAGDCATVGVAGGYTQGGGHSALSSKFGLGADQALEWEVVDGQGRLLTASRTENTDLYWAISGGGGGTYGVVYSLTVKVYKDFPITGFQLAFNSTEIGTDKYYDAVGHFHTLVPGYTTVGGGSISTVTNESFLITPLSFPDMRKDDAIKIFQPFLDYLDDEDIKYELNVTESKCWLDHYEKLILRNPTQLVENVQYGGRFIPREIIESRNDELTTAMRSVANDGVTLVSIGLNVSSSVVGEDVYNSVHPSWREAAMFMLVLSPWPIDADLTEMAVNAKKMTEEWIPTMAAVTPEAGCYMSESDPREVDWKRSFYGSNYERLHSIKNKFDPERLFYGNTSVGSDDWQVQADGRLCFLGGD